MSFTVEDFHDLVRILEEKPEWGAALRPHVLTRELLALPEQIASLRVETEKRFQALAAQLATLTEQVTELVEVQKRMAGQITELTGTVRILKDDVAELKGDALNRTTKDSYTPSPTVGHFSRSP